MSEGASESLNGQGPNGENMGEAADGVISDAPSATGGLRLWPFRRAAESASDAETAEPTESKSLGARAREELAFFVKLAAVMLVLFTFVFGHFKIPSESMQPQLEVGDHLYASKHAYGYSRSSLPFNLHRLPLGDWHVFKRVPERGDVVVFRHPVSDLVMIKRVVGLPGDTVAMVNGRLAVNGIVLAREEVERFRYRDFAHGELVEVTEYREALPGEQGDHLIWERGDAYPYDDRGPWVVPEDTVFMMGDNRDGSVDSRSPTGPGFVPLDHLIGRAEFIVFSFNRCERETDLRCPGRRALQRL